MTKGRQVHLSQASKIDKGERTSNSTFCNTHMVSSLKAGDSLTSNRDKEKGDFNNLHRNSCQMESNAPIGSPSPAASFMKDATTNVNIKSTNSIPNADAKQSVQNPWAQKITSKEKNLNLKSTKA